MTCSTDQFDQTLDRLSQCPSRDSSKFPLETLNRNGSSVGNLDPRRRRQHAVRNLHRQREPNRLRLASNSHDDYRFGFTVEQFVTQNEDRPESSLLTTLDRVEIRPIDIASQYGGHDSSPIIPSSASLRSACGSILASSRAKRVLLFRSESRSTADCKALLRFWNLPSRTMRSSSATLRSSRVTAIFRVIYTSMTNGPTRCGAALCC